MLSGVGHRARVQGLGLRGLGVQDLQLTCPVSSDHGDDERIMVTKEGCLLYYYFEAQRT